MSLSDFLKDQASKQLDKGTKAVAEGEWLDKVVAQMRSAVDKTDIDETFKSGLHAEINTLESNKEKIAGLGADAFTLMMQQLAAGKQDDAAKTFVKASGSADDLIEAMDRGTEGLIDAKKAIDKMWDDAWELITDIAITGARQILPLLLAL